MASPSLTRSGDQQGAETRSMVQANAKSIAWFTALLATALAMGAALAHAFALPNKIGMNEADYFAAQQAYRGWSQLAFLLLVEAAGMLALLVLYWKSRLRTALLIALGALIASQIVFWAFTFPANIATDNWTNSPGNWAQLRAMWEYSHLAGALFQVCAMIALIVAVLSRPVKRS